MLTNSPGRSSGKNLVTKSKRPYAATMVFCMDGLSHIIDTPRMCRDQSSGKDLVTKV